MLERLPPFTVISLLVVGLIVSACYFVTPYIGAAVLSIVDGVLYGLRWLGFHSPVACGSVVGALAGAAMGTVVGFAKAGKANAKKPIMLGVALGLLILALGGLTYRETMKPVTPQVAATPTVVQN